MSGCVRLSHPLEDCVLFVCLFFGPCTSSPLYLFIFPFIFISWRLITLQYCSGFCHTLTWISHGFTCVPHPDPLSRLPPHPIPLGLPSAPALVSCTIAGLRVEHQYLPGCAVKLEEKILRLYFYFFNLIFKIRIFLFSVWSTCFMLF